LKNLFQKENFNNKTKKGVCPELILGYLKGAITSKKIYCEFEQNGFVGRVASKPASFNTNQLRKVVTLTYYITSKLK